MSYKRDIENTSKGIFDADNKWNIPELRGCDLDLKLWQEESGGVCVGFNYCKSYEEKHMPSNEVGVHFFLNDYQFDRLWARPSDYIERLKQFKFVCAPDYSLYTDHPKAVQVFNHYKKHWLGKYWESNGLTVIPTICWSDCESFEWCFDGEPKESAVAISTKGTQMNEESKERFYAGYYQMLKRLQPKEILLFGKDPGGLDGNVIYMGYEFQDRFRWTNKI